MLIQKLRLQRGWSQEQLAEVSGLSAQTVQRLERGQPASLESLKALASAFDLDLKDLQEPSMTSNPTEPGLKDIRQDEAQALKHVRKVRRNYGGITVNYGDTSLN